MNKKQRLKGLRISTLRNTVALVSTAIRTGGGETAEHHDHLHVTNILKLTAELTFQKLPE